MKIFPKFRVEEEAILSPELILASFILAVRGQTTNEVELTHMAASLSGPANDAYLVPHGELREHLASAGRLLQSRGLANIIAEANERLNERQKLATLVTIMDLCMVENSLLDGEKQVFTEIRSGLGVGEDELRPFEEMLILKNDASIRINVMPSAFNRAAEGFRSLV